MADVEEPIGCSHLSAEILTKIANSAKGHDNFAPYSCLQCSAPGNLPAIDKHLTKSKHSFAVSINSVYCGACKDLVYEPAIPIRQAKKRKVSDASDEDVSYMTTNSSQKPCGREGVRGLFNLGETCYMNAVLQMLVHNQLLSSYFLSMRHPVHLCPNSKEYERKDEDSDDDEDELSGTKPEYKPCVVCAMSEVFAEARMSDQPTPAHAVNLLFASWKAIPHMAGKSQQDAQEWFMMIVDKLHDSVKTSVDKKGRCRCFFHKAFFGRLRSEVTCDVCHTVSQTQEPYSTISLDFKKQGKKRKKAAPDAKTAAVPNVLDCLKSYTSAESLPAEAYKCSGCNAPRPASKRLRIRKLPAILCVHVKRFGMRQVGNSFIEEKYQGKIDFPLSLDMAPYTTRPSSKTKEKFMYDLESVVVHQGEQIQNGHYYAFCRQDEKWFRYDDEIVSATTTEDVLRQEAYLLFYTLRRIGEIGGA